MFLVHVLAGQIKTLRIPEHLHVSDVLPHIHLVIGSEEDSVYLKALYDTGAGLNMGRRSYHEQIYKVRPDLVALF